MENNSKTFHGVHVLKATGLISADWGSESDPYFICRVGRKDSNWSEKFLEIQSQGTYGHIRPHYFRGSRGIQNSDS